MNEIRNEELAETDREQNLSFSGYTGIAKKMVAISSECGHVVKNGFNDFHKYKYATAADVLEAVNASLVKHKVASIATPSILSSFDVTNAKGNVEHQVTVGINITLIDSESGEFIDLYGIGTGQDAGDKAVMKAETAAIKYAYLLSMAISTGDDPEADTTTDADNSRQAPVQAKVRNTAIDSRTDAHTHTDAAEAICSKCGKEISNKVFSYSMNRYHKPLCMDCQKKEGRAA